MRHLSIAGGESGSVVDVHAVQPENVERTRGSFMYRYLLVYSMVFNLERFEIITAM